MRKDQIRLTLNKGALAAIAGEDFMIELSDNIRKEVRQIANKEFEQWKQDAIQNMSKNLYDYNSVIHKHVREIKCQVTKDIETRFKIALKQEIGEQDDMYRLTRNAVNEIKEYWDEEKSKILSYINEDIQKNVEAIVKASLAKILK